MDRGRPIVLTAVISLVLLLGTGAGVNESIDIDGGVTVNKELQTVNGGIRIGDGATVNGEATSVNGGIEIGRDVQLQEVTSVNGSIEIDEGSQIDGAVSTVNGGIELGRGVRADSVGTVNGEIELSGADVRGDVNTYNGNVTLTAGATVGGDIVVEERDGRWNQRQPLIIEIGDGSSVMGDIRVEQDNYKVEVHLSGGGHVAGEIIGAKIVKG